MKMKKSDFAISFKLRKLAQNEIIKKMVSELNEKRHCTETVSAFLYLANEHFNEICSNPNRYEDRDEAYGESFDLNDSKLIKELINIKVLSKSEIMMGDDDDFSAFFKIIIPEYIEHYYEWTKDSSLILNYGIFSLHKFTGEAYCQDNKYIFDTNDGLFRVFKEFLSEPTHILSYKKINDIFKNDNFNEPDPLVVQQAIYKIKRKLGMEGEIGKLFLSSDREYFLRMQN